MTSPASRSARKMANADLPDAVGPTTTTRCGFASCAFIGKADVARGPGGKSAQRERGGCFRGLVGARVALMRIIGLQVVIIRETQLDVRTDKGRGEGLTRIGAGDGADRGAIQRIFAGPEHRGRVATRYS